MTPIRPMVARDEAALIELWVAAWRPAMPAIDFDGRRQWLRDRLAALMNDGASVLVAGGDEPVGFVSIDPSGFIDQLAVHPLGQKQGVAGSLLEAALAHSPGGLRLTVNTDNIAAVRFYRRFGFTVSGHGVNPTSGLPVFEMRFSPTG